MFLHKPSTINRGHMSGWIQLHRKLLDNPIFKNHKLLQTFLYCLLRASHKEHDILIGEAIVHLKKGELATGRKAISAATGLTEQNVRTSLSKLETLSILTINPTTKYSIISISNWDSYQQTNQQVTNSQPTSNQQVTTNNNVNKGNNVNNTYKHIDLSELPVEVSIDDQKSFIDYKIKWSNKNKKPAPTDRAIKQSLNQAVRINQELGISYDEIFGTVEEKGWSGINIEYFDKPKFRGSFNQQHQENKPGRAFGE